ncbi:hypothetical protein CC86DRAFT_123419 [Ophiobolus disseminans]|uniref:Uncharacterized protein n=1 Tax=Ophiobolus disseminans TaxID=1469910 RepID=A0A6A6ZG21_9PLEO|nr:hypothetical protein CC86DRAFT_123419 [Ophiobolus disseminans]
MTCKAADGTMWNVSTGGVAKRAKGDEEDEPTKEVNTTETKSIGERLSTRKRSRFDIPLATTDTLPRFLSLQGKERAVGVVGVYFTEGTLYVNREQRITRFGPNVPHLIGTELQEAPSSIVQRTGQELHIERNGTPMFIFHYPAHSPATGNNTRSGPPTHLVEIDIFVVELRKCLLPSSQTQKNVIATAEYKSIDDIT